jgi:hypothetical protein
MGKTRELCEAIRSFATARAREIEGSASVRTTEHRESTCSDAPSEARFRTWWGASVAEEERSTMAFSNSI